MGTLSRNEMEQVINSGGSVLLGGRLYTRVADLPNDAQLAAGDPEREAAAATTLQQQIAQMQAQLEQLQASGQSAALQQPPAEHPLDTIVGSEFREKLTAAGVETPDDVREATDAQLLDIDGIGPATVKKLRAAYGQG